MWKYAADQAEQMAGTQQESSDEVENSYRSAPHVLISTWLSCEIALMIFTEPNVEIHIFTMYACAVCAA